MNSTFLVVNPSFTKPFSTHTFYQGDSVLRFSFLDWAQIEGGGDGQADPPAISETVAPMKVKFCRILETPLKVLGMLKLFT